MDPSSTTHEFLFVALSIIALAVGPTAYSVLGKVRLARRAFDGFVLTSVAGLVLVHILPSALEAIGGWAAVFGLAGLAFPFALERAQGVIGKRAHAVTLSVAVLAFIMHTGLDGLGIATISRNQAGVSLGVAILVHRLPVGLTLWWLLRPRYGVKGACLAVALVAATTLIGFAAGNAMVDAAEGVIASSLQIFAGGALMHVMLHPADAGRDEAHSRRAPLVETAGALVGLVLVVFTPEMAGDHTNHHHGAGYWPRFVQLIVETAPALLIGYGVAGLVAELLPRIPAEWTRGGSALTQAGRGVAFGVPLPICSCGVVPLYRSLVRLGVPPAAGFAFLVATPELGIESILLSVPLLGGPLTAARLGAALIAALVIGWFVSRFVPTPDAEPAAQLEAPDKASATGEKMRRAARYGFGELVDHTAAWILVGIAVAAAIEPATLEPLLARVPAGADVFVMALVGMPLYVCASGATPLAAALIAAGVSPGAGVAFLLSGPATNITTFGVLSSLHGRRAAFLFAAAMVASATALGAAVNLALHDVPGLPLATAGEHDPSLVAWGLGGLLAVVFGLSIIRLGPRTFVGSLFSEDPHDHHHHDHHGHGHHHHDHDHHGAHAH